MARREYNVVAVRNDREADMMFLSDAGTWVFPIRMEMAKKFTRKKEAEKVAVVKQKTLVAARTVMVVPA